MTEKYWEDQKGTINGVLDGFELVNDEDIRFSKKYLLKHKDLFII
jgi:hypothetical protein